MIKTFEQIVSEIEFSLTKNLDIPQEYINERKSQIYIGSLDTLKKVVNDEKHENLRKFFSPVVLKLVLTQIYDSIVYSWCYKVFDEQVVPTIKNKKKLAKAEQNMLKDMELSMFKIRFFM